MTTASSIHSASAVQLVALDGVVEFARLLARAAARRVVREHGEIHVPAEALTLSLGLRIWG